MDIFLTGGTGYVGGAVLSALLEGGHRVRALARSRDSARTLGEAGAQPVEGDMGDPGSYVAPARECHALIHAAADHGGDKVAADRTAIESFLAAAADGEVRVVVYTSGCWILGDTGDEPADEHASVQDPPEVVAWRPAHEQRVLDAATDELATAVVRPGMVYGGGRGLISAFFAQSEEQGAPTVVGDGSNRWPPVHRDDVGALYRRVVEMEARGVYHATDGSAPRVEEVARAISGVAGSGELRTKPLAEARSEMGAKADALCLDQAMAAPRSLRLGWEPRRGPLLDEIERLHREWKAARED